MQAEFAHVLFELVWVKSRTAVCFALRARYNRCFVLHGLFTIVRWQQAMCVFLFFFIKH